MAIPRILQSSADPKSVSLTVKGILVAIIPVAIAVGQHYGISFTEAQITETIDSIVQAVAGLMVVYGLVRKAIVWYQNR